MNGLETAIRNALERSDRTNAEARARIYQSARHALEAGLRKQEINDPQVIAAQRQRLEALIHNIESAERARLHGASPRPAAAPAAPSATPSPTRPAAPAPAAKRDEGMMDVRGETRNAGASARPGKAPAGDFGDLRAERAGSGNVSAASPEVAAPGARASTGKASGRTPDMVADAAGRPRKHRRGFFSRLFIYVVLLAFIALGGWWVHTSGLLLTAAQRDTSVPNPPVRIEDEDFNGSTPPQALDAQQGFSDDWIEVFTPEQMSSLQARSDALVESVSASNGRAVRLTSRSSGENGDILIEVPVDMLQQLAGRSSTIAVTMQSSSDRSTQVSIRCDFASLGDCARHRFTVTPERSDALFRVTFERSLAPNTPGHLLINSDLEGRGQAVNLYSVRILPGQ